MIEFKRGITNKRFIDDLQDCDYWKDMIADPMLFIGIRNEYINVYYNGNSICKLTYGDAIIAETHYKYLLRPDKNAYIKTSDGNFEPNILADKSIASLSDIDLIKRASSVYAGVEKKGVHLLSLNKKNILDVEIAFSKEEKISKKGKELKRNPTDRVDYLMLEKRDDGNIYLVFVEAKHFSNKEIRSAETPEVLEQVDRYKKTLKENQQAILHSYVTVCDNLSELNIIGNRHLIQEVADTHDLLSIDFQPRLIIFGYDTDQDKGEVWGVQKEKLRNALGDRLMLQGNCK